MSATRTLLFGIGVLLAVTIVSCEDERHNNVTGPLMEVRGTMAEGELFGYVFGSNGLKTTDTNYYVYLDPDGETSSRLDSYFLGTAWVDPDVGDSAHAIWMYEWTDPKAGGQCGNLEDYILGDTTGRQGEAHWTGPGEGAGPGKEKHCLRPGRYEFRLFQTGTGVVKSFDIDYVPVKHETVSTPLRVWNDTWNVEETVEAIDYDDTANVWIDLVIHVDLSSTSFIDSGVLHVQNIGSDSTDLWDEYIDFEDATSPTGYEEDWFRFSVAPTTTEWNRNTRGKALSRLHWDWENNPDWKTGFYDALSNGHGPGDPDNNQYVIRGETFGGHMLGDTSQYFYPLHEVMHPNEDPNDDAADTTEAERSIYIVVPDPLSNSISGTDYITVSRRYYWSASASGGITPYTYMTWDYYRPPGSTDSVGYGSSYSRYVTVEEDSYIFRLQNYVKDQTPDTARARQFVDVEGSGGGEKAAQGDGVVFADGFCRPRPTERAAHQAFLRDLFNKGENVKRCWLKQEDG